ncbi:MotA/TolQ/ExbB proton channel family protein [Salinisphaera sp. PC39]|uniref:MotA/TolQ/ExbB proton channel family protein n=1 Tax=Salinisphaera sp. PC39 TaxID=1304156 RepID=UPI00333EE33D
MQDFMNEGGEVLWLILALTILLWTLICERYWYQLRRHPQRLAATLAAWNERRDKNSWYAHAIREAWLAELELQLNRFVGLLKTVVAVLPLVGLLGTVTGMIQVFDVLAVTGTGNPRAMASGVSAATYPTMAGMVAALSGLYFAARIERRAQAQARIAADRISFLDEE